MAFAAVSDGTKSLVRNNMSAFLDPGCTSHLFNDHRSFSELHEISRVTVQATKSGSSFQATGRGIVTRVLTHNGKSTVVKLKNVLYCPELAINLVLVSKSDDAGMQTEFGDGAVLLKMPDGNIFGSGRRLKNQNLY